LAFIVDILFLEKPLQVGKPPIKQIPGLMPTPTIKSGNLLDRQIQKIELDHPSSGFDETADRLGQLFFKVFLVGGFCQIISLHLGDPVLLLIQDKSFITLCFPEHVDHRRTHYLLKIRREIGDLFLTAHDPPELDPDLLTNIFWVDSKTPGIELADLDLYQAVEPIQQRGQLVGPLLILVVDDSSPWAASSRQ
jgi:hypothetical protein